MAADRQFETQAAIVRVMKQRKTISHAELVAEVIKATRDRGAVEVGDIKKNIDKYVELVVFPFVNANILCAQAHREGIHGAWRGQFVRVPGVSGLK